MKRWRRDGGWVRGREDGRGDEKVERKRGGKGRAINNWSRGRPGNEARVYSRGR